MSRAWRWQILVPRLLTVAVVLLAAQYVLGLVARSIAIRSTKAALGTQLDVGNTRVSLLDRQVVLNDLRLVNPRSPEEYILEADRCELDIEAQPLLHKQAIVNHGRLSGLSFTAFAGRENSASSQTPEGGSATKWFHDDAEAVASQWLAHLAERFKHDLVGQFESVKRTEAFCANWSSQSAALEARGQQLDQRMEKLREAFTAAQSNPLRNDRFFADLPQQIADLQQEFASVNAELAKLPDQLESERRAIVAARRHDEELVHQRVKLEPIEANALNAYLLRAEAARPLDELVDRLRWLRAAVPASAPTRPAGQRGEDILFAACSRAPNVLIRTLELRGSARIANQPVELHGKLTDFATEPALVGGPMRLRLETTGSLPLELQATIDRTPGKFRDEVLIDCRGVLLPRLALGQTDELALTIAPSLGSLLVSVTVDGEKLTGDIQMVQQDVRLTPAVGNEFEGLPIAEALNETLGRVDSLATRVSLGGTLAEPKCTLWSNLGPAVAAAMERALERAGGQHAHAMLVDAGKQVDERLTGVERQMSDQQAHWTARATDAKSQLQTFAAAEAPQDRISPERLGRRLPSNSLFR